MKKTKFLSCIKCIGRGYVGRYESGDGWASSWSEPCKECNGQGYIEVPMTNADCIRKMDDSELLNFIRDVHFEGYLEGHEDCWVGRRPNLAMTLNKMKEWLNQPVEVSE